MESPFVKVKNSEGRTILMRRSIFRKEQLESFERLEDGTYIPTPEAPPDPNTRECQTELDDDIILANVIQKLKLEDFESIPVKGQLVQKAKLIVSNTIRAFSNIKYELGQGAQGTIFDKITPLVSAVSGVSEAQVNRLRIDPPTSVDDSPKGTPKSKRDKNLESLRRLPEGVETAIRVEMQAWWREERNVTLNFVREWLQEEFDVHVSPAKVARILYAMGYSYRLKTYNPLVNSKDFIVQWKARYIRQIQECRAQNALIGYFDETWVFSGISHQRGWAYTNDDPYAIVARGGVENVTPGPVKAATKGKRAIVLAVQTEKGIVDGSVQVLISGEKVEQQTMDYHKMMTTKTFEEYMQLVLPLLRDEAELLDRPAVLVIDNASYHCRPLQKLPDASTKKADLITFLRSKGVGVKNQLRPELWKMAQEWIEQNGGRKALTEYWVDDFGASLGVQIIRLPPYHCEFNPIELVWGQLKTFLKSVGKSGDSLRLVRERAMQWLNEYTEELSQATMLHVIKKEEEVAAAITAKQLAVDALMNEVDDELGDDTGVGDPAGSFPNPEDLESIDDSDGEINVLD